MSTNEVTKCQQNGDFPKIRYLVILLRVSAGVACFAAVVLW
jgi:hypothetical protein